jgi:hypothetical protein
LAVSFDVTAVAVAVKNAPIAPAGTVTVAGTVNAVLLLDRLTVNPPAGAAAVRFTVHASLPAPVIVPLWQKRVLSVPAAASPVPLKLTSAVPLVGAFVTTVSVPVAAPAVAGSNFTSTVTEFPGFSVTGKLCPAIVNPAPATVAELMVKAAVPDDSSVTNCGVACVLTVTSPKARLLALRLRAAVPVAACGLSCRANVAELVPTLAVIVAVCVALTAAAIAVKVALLRFAPISTDEGTVTAESLLARLTDAPPLLAGALSVTVQVSVPAPVIVALVHETALTVVTGVSTVLASVYV